MASLGPRPGPPEPGPLGAPPGPAPLPYFPPGKTCSGMMAADRATGAPFRYDQVAVEDARDRYLAQTEVGRYAIAVFYNNRERIEDRANATPARGADRSLAQALYGRYSGDAKLALADPDRADLGLTQQQMADAEVAFAAWKKYLEEDEARAADALAELARSKARIGMTARDGLAVLDDRRLLEQVKAIAATVDFLDTDV